VGTVVIDGGVGCAVDWSREERGLLQDEASWLEEVRLSRRGVAVIAKEELQPARPLGRVQGDVVVGDLDTRD
jgi:hypothetical protein